MNINIICIGKLKEKYWADAASEYKKRIGGFCNIKIVELKESKLPKNASPSDEEIVKEKEGESILSKIGERDFVIALEILGKQMDSLQLAKSIRSAFDEGNQTIDFVIGGSLGLADEVSKRANEKLSFSKMTFPHQMARIMILEQVYRAFKIMNGETYHK